MKKLLILLVIICGISFCQETKETTEYKLAVQLYNDKLYDLAEEQFKRFLEVYPNTQLGIMAKYYLGLAQFQLKKFDDAKTTFQTFAVAFQQHPQAPEAWWKVAECYIQLKRYNDAATTFERLKLFHPTNELAPKALIQAADCAVQVNDLENALKYLKILIQDYSFNQISGYARFKIAEIYAKQDIFDKAINEYKKLIDEAQLEDLKIKSQIALAKIYVRTGKIELADEYLNKILKTNTRKSLSDSINFELGIVYEELGDYILARNYYSNLIDTSFINSESGQIMEVTKLGLLHFIKVQTKLQDYKNALENSILFENKFNSDQILSEIWPISAEIYFALNDLNNSNKYLIKILNDSSISDKRKILLKIAENDEALGKYNEANDYYNSFIDKYPSDQCIPEILYRSGKNYCIQLKDYRKSIAKFESILTKYPTSVFTDDAQFYLGLAYEYFKDYDRALEYYNELIQKFPNSEYYNQASEKIENINLFVSNTTAEGFQKIGLLLQEVINDKSKSEIAYKIGEVYFNDLKNYKSAISQFDIVLSSNVTDSLKREAAYYKAACNYFIALSDSSNIITARTELDNFIRKYPDYKKDMLLSFTIRLEISGKTDSAISEYIDTFIKKYPKYLYADQLNYKLLLSAIKMRNYEKVKLYSENILSNYPESKYLEEALFYKNFAQIKLSLDTVTKNGFQKYIDDYPNGRFVANSLFYLAQINRIQKEFQKALSKYSQIIEKYYYTDFNFHSRDESAMTYFEMGDYKSAYNYFVQQLKTVQSNLFLEENQTYDYLYKIALCYEKLNEQDNAIKYYKTYILKNKNGIFYNNALFNIGMLLQKAGKSNFASGYFSQIQTKPDETELVYKIADLFFENHKYKESLEKYKIVLQNTNNENVKRFSESRIIILNYRMENPNEAEKLIKAYSSHYKNIDNDLIEFEYEKGYHYYRIKEYSNSNKIFEEIIDDYEKSEFAAWSSYWLGKYYESIDQNERAIKKFEWVTTNFKSSKAACRSNLALGNIYFRNEKYGDAVKFYKVITDQKIDDPQIFSSALNNIIIAYGEIGIYDAAIEYCRKFIESFPDDETLPDKKLKIGILYQKLKYYDQAIIHFQSLLEMSEKTIEQEIRYYLGECYFSKTDYQQALLEFLKIPFLHNKNTKSDWVASALYMAGQCYEKMNKFDQAITMYRQIIDRSGIDSTFKAQAEKEIDRVKRLLLPEKK